MTRYWRGGAQDTRPTNSLVLGGHVPPPPRHPAPRSLIGPDYMAIVNPGKLNVFSRLRGET